MFQPPAWAGRRIPRGAVDTDCAAPTCERGLKSVAKFAPAAPIPETSPHRTGPKRIANDYVAGCGSAVEFAIRNEHLDRHAGDWRSETTGDKVDDGEDVGSGY